MSADPVQEALSALWCAIRARHPHAPDIQVHVAPARSLATTREAAVPGCRGRVKSGTEAVHLFVDCNVLSVSVLNTLLHTAAHVVNSRKDRADCTHAKYHNRNFRTAAEALELDVRRDQRLAYGLASTSPTATAVRAYADQLTSLAYAVLVAGPVVQQPPVVKPGGRLWLATCMCDPPTKIRVPRAVAAAANLTCRACGATFVLAR